MAKDDDGKLINTMTKSSEPGRKVVPSVMWYLENQIRRIAGSAMSRARRSLQRAARRTSSVRCALRAPFRRRWNYSTSRWTTRTCTYSFEIQCADRSSPFPVQLIKSPDIAMVNDNESFNLRNVWSLHPVMTATSFHNKGIAQAGGLHNFYPAFAVSCRVDRLYIYYVYNIILPMAVFSHFYSGQLLDRSAHSGGSFKRLAHSRTDSGDACLHDRSSMVPTVSYLTLIEYVLVKFFFICVVAIQACIFGLEAGPVKATFPSLTMPAWADLAAALHPSLHLAAHAGTHRNAVDAHGAAETSCEGLQPQSDPCLRGLAQNGQGLGGEGDGGVYQGLEGGDAQTLYEDGRDGGQVDEEGGGARRDKGWGREGGDCGWRGRPSTSTATSSTDGQVQNTREEEGAPAATGWRSDGFSGPKRDCPHAVVLRLISNVVLKTTPSSTCRRWSHARCRSLWEHCSCARSPSCTAHHHHHRFLRRHHPVPIRSPFCGPKKRPHLSQPSGPRDGRRLPKQKEEAC